MLLRIHSLFLLYQFAYSNRQVGFFIDVGVLLAYLGNTLFSQFPSFAGCEIPITPHPRFVKDIVDFQGVFSTISKESSGRSRRNPQVPLMCPRSSMWVTVPTFPIRVFSEIGRVPSESVANPKILILSPTFTIRDTGLHRLHSI